MGISLMVLIVFIGLGIVAIIVTVVVVVFISRRDDFVNPFAKSSRNEQSTPVQPKNNISSEVPKDIAPHLYRHPETDQEAALIDWLVAEASAQTGVNLTNDKLARERLVDAARKAMKELEEIDSTQISLPFLAADSQGPKHFEIKISRQMLDQF